MNRLPVFVRQHIAAFRALLVFTVLCGLIYPAVMVGVAQLVAPNHANGSQVSFNGRTVTYQDASALWQAILNARQDMAVAVNPERVGGQHRFRFTTARGF